MKTQDNQPVVTKKHRHLTLAYWAGAWVLSIAIANFGSKFLWDYNKIISAVAIIVSTLIGIGMIIANIKFLQNVDELQRKITLDAMAIALGVGVVGDLSYAMLTVTKVIPFDAEISNLVILIGISYLAAILIGNFRYQ